MAEEAVKIGITKICATPHAFHPAFDVSPRKRDEVLAAFQTELANRNIPLEILPGFECFVIDSLSQKIAENPQYLLPSIEKLGDERHVLIEVGQSLPVEFLANLSFDFQLRGITPVLAHPERCPEVRRNPEVIRPFVNGGGKLQVTVRSLAGNSDGSRTRDVCEYLLEQDLVAILASDAHCAEDMQITGRVLRDLTDTSVMLR